MRRIMIGLALGLMANGAPAAEPATGQTWALATDDTELTLSVADNTLSLVELRHPAQGWNWTPAPSPSPLPGVNGQKVEWTFRDASVTKTNGRTVSLRFTSTDPALELTSVWRARPGVGPVEHQIGVVNKTDGPIVFKGDDIEAANLSLVADKPVQFFPLDAAVVGPGEGTPLPYQIVKVGSAHGIYLAYDYGRGPAFNMRDYHSVEDFKRKWDKWAKVGVGWENCCNGGNLRSLDICRRMTFMTHSDASGLIPLD